MRLQEWVRRLRTPIEVAAITGGILLAAFVIGAALPNPSSVQESFIEMRVKQALDEIENYGVAPGLDSLPLPADIAESMRADANQRFAANLAEPLKSQWVERTRPYLDRLVSGETMVFSKGVKWSAWAFESTQVSGGRATVTGTATKCDPYIDFSEAPPVEGNPCGEKAFKVTLVDTNGKWLLSELEMETVDGG